MNITIIFITLSSYHLYIYIVHIITLIYMISLLLILLVKLSIEFLAGKT